MGAGVMARRDSAGGDGWHAERILRLALTALLYLAFGIGALVSAIMVVLPLAICSRDQQDRIRRVRAVNRFTFNSFTRSGEALGVFESRFVNRALLEQPGQLVIANHPSLLDVVYLMGRIPAANCVVKNALLRNPFLALQVRFAGYIRNDAGEEMLAQCRECLERGESLIIFPEGTRTKRGGDRRFRRGAAYLMLLTEAPVRPVHVRCDPVALGKHDPWYHVPPRRISYRFSVLPLLDIEELRESTRIRMPLKGRRLTRLLENWYDELDTAQDVSVYPAPATADLLDAPPVPREPPESEARPDRLAPVGSGNP